MSPGLIVTLVVAVVVIFLVIVGIKLIKGSWVIPEDKKEKAATVGIIGAIILGLASMVAWLNPDWRKRLEKRLASTKRPA